MTAIENANIVKPSWEVWEPVCVFGMGMLGFVGWTLFAGPDVSWDFLHYHLYLGLNAGGGRLAQDFFPASSSSYLTPYAYWPLAAMIAAKLPAMVVGSSIACLHSLATLATWYLAKQLFPDGSRKALVLRLAATVLAVVSPIVLTEVGSSSIDITSAVPAVAGIALMLRAVQARSGMRPCILSGICFGIATALKLTNATYALTSLLTMAILLCLRSNVTWKMVLAFAAAEGAGFALAYGPWGFQLWREFGNPFFPFLNGHFLPSPVSGPPGLVSGKAFSLGDVPDWLIKLRGALHQRFLPLSLNEWLLRPLYMLDPVPGVYVEFRAPDARFLALFGLAPFAIWRMRSHLRSSGLAVLLIFVLLSWILWLALFGNGRYLMPLLLAVGPALVCCASTVWTRESLPALIAVTLFVCVQATLLESSRYRFAETAWADRWVDAKLPPQLLERPATYVVFGVQSNSWLSAFVHPDSRFVHRFGRNVRVPRGQEDRFTAVLANSSEIMAVFRYEYFDSSTNQPIPALPPDIDATGALLGLRVDSASCQTGSLIEPGAERTAVSMRNGKPVTLIGIYGLFFCRATYQPYFKDVAPINPLYAAVFANVERSCPRQFPPGSGETTCSSGGCWRKYYSTDKDILIDGNGNVSSHYFGAYQMPVLGAATDLADPSAKVDCHEDLGRYRPWNPGANLFITGPKPLGDRPSR